MRRNYSNHLPSVFPDPNCHDTRLTSIMLKIFAPLPPLFKKKAANISIDELKIWMA
jgi:hypothetical protein